MIDNPWLFRYTQKPEARVRLFCFHYAGGTGQVFQKWASILPSTIEVCSIQLPGRMNRFNEELMTDIQSIVTSFSENIKPLLDKPFAVFGHSLGALLAFEWVRHLRKTSGPLPIQLFVSA